MYHDVRGIRLVIALSKFPSTLSSLNIERLCDSQSGESGDYCIVILRQNQKFSILTGGSPVLQYLEV